MAKKRGLTFRPSSLGRREGGKGGTSQAFPWKGKGDHEVVDEVDLSLAQTNLHFAVRRNIIARRAISFPKEISFAAGKHHCRRRRLGGRSPVRGRGGAPLWGAPVLFSVCRKQNLRPHSYGCSAHFAEKRKFKDFGLKSFDFTGEKLRPAVREGFPERTA